MANQLPGDIILVRGAGKSSDVIVALQRPLGFGEPRFSHAMLCLSPCLFIHSDENGVHLKTYSELFPAVYSSTEMMAIRRRDMDGRSDEEADALRRLIQDRAQHYLGQAYNAAFVLKGLWKEYDTTSFCSELIAKVYRDANLPLSRSNPQWVFPVHLQALETDANWIKVTDAYVPPFPYERLMKSLKALNPGGDLPALLDLLDPCEAAENMRVALLAARQAVQRFVTHALQLLQPMLLLRVLDQCTTDGLAPRTIDQAFIEQALGGDPELKMLCEFTTSIAQWYWDGLRKA